jgi:hypothetical protein
MAGGPGRAPALTDLVCKLWSPSFVNRSIDHDPSSKRGTSGAARIRRAARPAVTRAEIPKTVRTPCVACPSRRVATCDTSYTRMPHVETRLSRDLREVGVGVGVGLRCGARLAKGAGRWAAEARPRRFVRARATAHGATPAQRRQRRLWCHAASVASRALQQLSPGSPVPSRAGRIGRVTSGAQRRGARPRHSVRARVVSCQR